MGAGTWESHHAITGLLYHYADCVDRADWDGLAELFAHGRLRAGGSADAVGLELRGEQLPAFYARANVVHPDGTLRTRHLTTNAIVEIDEALDAATARSQYVVLQATPTLPLQPIAAGRYEDRFERVAGTWRFADRRVHLDLVGDVSQHLAFALDRDGG